MNITTKTFNRRSMAEPWRGVIERYRAPLLHRLWPVIVQVTFVCVVFGAAGVGSFMYLSR
jgi:hypothetical protein